MAPKAQKGTLMDWGANKGPWDQRTQNLELGSSFKRTQILVKLAPSFHDLHF